MQISCSGRPFWLGLSYAHSVPSIQKLFCSKAAADERNRNKNSALPCLALPCLALPWEIMKVNVQFWNESRRRRRLGGEVNWWNERWFQARSDVSWRTILFTNLRVVCQEEIKCIVKPLVMRACGRKPHSAPADVLHRLVARLVIVRTTSIPATRHISRALLCASVCVCVSEDDDVLEWNGNKRKGIGNARSIKKKRTESGKG